jgi:acetylornithine/N-succinyldiaminopimelate aminotransferase
MSPRIAGIIVEPVQGEGGVVPAPLGFLEGLRELADQHGCLLIADEIQTGGGRTGRFLAFHHEKVRPDVVTLAKAIGGGLPIGAMLCTEALKGSLPPGSHGSTFGGNALASAVSLAVLLEIVNKDLMGHAARLGVYLSERLQDLAARYNAAESARGRGLLQALVLAEGVDCRAFLANLRDDGLLLTVAGERALRFSPPLIVTQAQIDEGLEIIEKRLQSI